MPIVPEMRLYSPDGERLYLNAEERKRFLAALDDEEPEDRLFCHVLHYTGCRPAEARELVPLRVAIDEQSLVFQSLKKRKLDAQGNEKLPQFRTVPVPQILIEQLDLVFNIRAKLKRGRDTDLLLWTMSRATAWRLIKRVMDRAGIQGKQATGKGLRHGFGVAMVTAEKPLPTHVLSKLMGHANSEITEIYLQVVGNEERKLVIDAWDC